MYLCIYIIYYNINRWWNTVIVCVCVCVCVCLCVCVCVCVCVRVYIVGRHWERNLDDKLDKMIFEMSSIVGPDPQLNIHPQEAHTSALRFRLTRRVLCPLLLDPTLNSTSTRKRHTHQLWGSDSPAWKKSRLYSKRLNIHPQETHTSSTRKRLRLTCLETEPPLQ